MKRILLDSDILLDYFLNRQPFADNAEEILWLCETGKLKGFVTPVILSNIYYILRKSSKHQKVISKLQQLLSLIDVLEMNRNTVLAALNSHFLDFEDALQHFAADQAGDVEVIITRNIKDYKKGKLTAFSPNDFLATLNIN